MISGRWRIPENWNWVYAEEIADIISGGTPSTRDVDNFTGNGIPWLTPADLSNYQFTYIERGARDISEKGLKNSSARILPKGSVLFTSRAPIGYCVIASNKITTNQGFKSFVLHGNISPEFIRFYLLSSKAYAESLASGSTFKELSAKRVATLEIPLPPLNEQRHLVTKIESLKARTARVLDSLSTIPALLDQFRQSVLAAAFRGALTADWREQNPDVEPASVLLERIQKGKQEADAKTQRKSAVKPNIPLPDNLQFPKSWEIVISHDLFLFVTSGSRGWAQYYSDNGAIFIRVGNLNRNTISLDFTSVQRVNPSVGTEGTRTKVKPKDILISITADIGMVAVIPEDIPEAYINQHVALARPQEDLLSEYFAWYIASSECGFKQLKELQRGMTKIGLGLDDIRSIWIPLPPVEEQKEIVRKIQYFFKIADTIEQQYQQTFGAIDQLDQTILAQAFRGALVSQDPNDEPASVLLERIRAEREKNAGASPKRSKKSKPVKESIQMELELE